MSSSQDRARFLNAPLRAFQPLTEDRQRVKIVAIDQSQYNRSLGCHALGLLGASARFMVEATQQWYSAKWSARVCGERKTLA